MISQKRKTSLASILIERSFAVSSAISILSLGLITVYVVLNGLPGIGKVGLLNFILGMQWKPSENVFGIFPMIASSLMVTMISIVIGSIVGLSLAIFLAELAPKRVAGFVRMAVNVLAGIPSVIYGLFGLVVLVPIIRVNLGGAGNSLLAAAIILAAMIIPTIVSISETAIRSVPKDYKMGSLALGATEITTIFKVILPAAKSGIFASVVLGMGRAIGETMAVILVAGNTPLIPNSLLAPMRTLTANIAMEMGYAGGLHREMLFATGVVLFAFIMILNIALNFFNRKKDGE
jgi:phosphate transport system permease protein